MNKGHNPHSDKSKNNNSMSTVLGLVIGAGVGVVGGMAVSKNSGNSKEVSTLKYGRKNERCNVEGGGLARKSRYIKGLTVDGGRMADKTKSTFAWILLGLSGR